MDAVSDDEEVYTVAEREREREREMQRVRELWMLILLVSMKEKGETDLEGEAVLDGEGAVVADNVEDRSKGKDKSE